LNGRLGRPWLSYPGRTVGAVLDALFPLACPGCGRHGTPVCANCAAELRPAVSAPPPPGVDEWLAPFAYVGVARELVARVKYRNVRAVVPWLAAAMVGELHRRGRPIGVVTWAPTTPEHHRRRGFDPAELLAHAVTRQARARRVTLLRRLPGPPQTGLDAAARRRGPRFTAARAAPVRVLLVDDVATTGATLSAAARVLRDAGAREVVALTAARTPPPG
jgi:predicted amidophosphoribosyltransferase